MSELLDEPIDTPEAEAGAVAEPEAGAEPEAVAAPTPAPAEIDWNNVENLRAAAERLASMGYTIGTAAEPEPQAAEFEYDPYDPNSVLQTIAASPLGQTVEQFRQFVATQEQERVEGQIGGLLSRVADELKLGEIDTSRLRSVADSFAGEAASKYGQTPQAAEYAARRAGEWLASERKAAADAAVNAYKESIGQVASTPGEPGIKGGGLSIEERPSTYDAIIAKYEDRIRG